MKYYAAPMEGITGYVYRNAHHRYYGGMDKYFTPFLTPKAKKGMNSKERNDVIPEHNENIPVVPQILTNRAEDFVSMVERLEAMGYREVNLNLGCPSGTVVSKGKGCGFLADRPKLQDFFEDSMNLMESRGLGHVDVSVKTRLGLDDYEEILPLMEIYNQYPLSEVIIHARIHKDFYKRPVNQEAFGQALDMSKHSICYNGDLFSKKEYDAFVKNFPKVDKIMLGRGLIANPGLIEDFQEDKAFDYERFFDFHEEILQGYIEIMSGDRNVLFKMKELWAYMKVLFEGSEKIMKKIRKSNNLAEYRSAIALLSSR